MDTLPVHRKRAIDVLIKGHEFAKHLKYMLSKPIKNDGSLSVEDLVVKILGSFTETLSILKSTDSDEISQVPVNTPLGSPCSDVRRSEYSGESTKTSVLKDRRGSYKRRKTSQTSTRITATLIDDGYAWRKYGQKPIHNSKHPRNYYRCTHKYDQLCQATKQVQKTENDPPMYRTTYHGNHTCKKLHNDPQSIFDSTTPDSSFLLSFGSDDLKHKTDGPFIPMIKQEYKEDIPSLMNHNQSSSSDYLLSTDLRTFDSYGPMSVLSSISDHGDVISSGVYSCTTSTHSFEMDPMMLGSEIFDDMIGFDF